MDLTAPEKLQYAPFQITAVSTDVGAGLSYFGPQTYAEVLVADATGDISLRHGVDSSSEIADASLGLPIADETTGIMDVSDVEADTYGELFDYINGKANWRFRLGAVRRADLATNTLILKTATEVVRGTEVSLLRDSTVAVQTTTFTIGVRVTNRRAFRPSPFMDSGMINAIEAISATVSFGVVGSGAGYNDGEGALDGCRIIVYAVNDVLGTQRRLYYSPATLTTATAKVLTVADWGGLPLVGEVGEDLLVLVQNSGTGALTLTAPTIIVGGYQIEAGASRPDKTYRLSNT